MTLSRRSFFTRLATLIAAPAIVRAESLMKLAPTEIIKPSLRFIETYNPLEQTVTRLDVLYGYTQIRPDWWGMEKIDEYSERIIAPMVNRLAKSVADSVIYGNGVVWADHNSHELQHVPLAGLFREARATNSHE